MKTVRTSAGNQAGIEVADWPSSSREISKDVAEWFRAEFEKRARMLGPAAPLFHRWLFGSAEVRFRNFLRSEGPMFPAALRALNLDYQCSPEDALRIPKTGPVILVANHPYGVLEVPLLGALLDGIRSDVRFLATADAMLVPQVRELFFPIVRRRDLQPVDANRRSIRDAVRWLRSGGLVVVLPAGRVAARPFPAFKLTEQPWTDIGALLAQWSGAAVLPVFFHGCNHWMFYAASLLHRDLREVALIWQGLRNNPRVARISIGTPIQLQSLVAQSGLRIATAYLRSETLGLGAR